MASVVLNNLAAGVSLERVLKNYPTLKREDIEASPSLNLATLYLSFASLG